MLALVTEKKHEKPISSQGPQKFMVPPAKSVSPSRSRQSDDLPGQNFSLGTTRAEHDRDLCPKIPEGNGVGTTFPRKNWKNDLLPRFERFLAIVLLVRNILKDIGRDTDVLPATKILKPNEVTGSERIFPGKLQNRSPPQGQELSLFHRRKSFQHMFMNKLTICPRKNLSMRPSGSSPKGNMMSRDSQPNKSNAPNPRVKKCTS